MATGPSPTPVGEGPIPSNSPTAVDGEDSSHALEDRYRSRLSLTSDAVARFAATPPVSLARSVAEQADALAAAVLVECNDAMARLHGLRHASELVGSRLRDSFIRDDVRHQAFVTAFVSAGYRAEVVESADADNGPRHYVISMHGVIEDGELVGVWGSKTDVTERKRLERQARLVYATSSVARVAEGLARELDTMLTAIIASAEDLAHSARLPDDVNEDVRVIRRSARHGAELARQLLWLSDPEQLVEPPNAEAPARATATLLVVEDEPTVRLVMKRVLESAGYLVLVAGSGEEAVDVARAFSSTIDGLVTDVIMPGMTGSELARRLRAERPGLRVLHVSGYNAAALRHYEALDEGASFLQKPFAPDALLHHVAEVLAAPRR